MEIQCTDKELFFFKLVAECTSEIGCKSYVIGGFVRDKLLGRETKDIDIVCTGDGIELADKVASRLNSRPIVNFFKNFGTAQILMDDIDIEFVGARKESYDFNSRNPEVQPGTIEDDQRRRDFTINAMSAPLREQNVRIGTPSRCAP